jgi:UPF0755 protein
MSTGRRLLLAGAGLATLVAVVGGVWLARHLNPPGPPGPPVRVVIEPGTSVAGIAARLEDDDVLTSARVFRLYLKARRAEEGFQAGEYVLRRRMSMGTALAALRKGPDIAYQRLTVPEGLTLGEIAERVGRLPGRQAARFLELAGSGRVRSRWQPPESRSLEGLLFPDTYLVTDREDEAAILARLVRRFDEVATDVGLGREPRPAQLSAYQAIVAASLVEAEAKVPEDRPLIAAVIQNRLEAGMRLQIDATVLYALGRHKSRVLFRDLEVDSPYNTYKVDGLPPTPIAAPGRAALQAMLDPAEVDYRYYVLFERNGKHAFATTPAEFERLKAEARRKGVL